MQVYAFASWVCVLSAWECWIFISSRALFCIFMFGQHICDVIYTAHSCRNADKLGCGAPVTRTGCWTQDKSALVNTAVFTVELLNLNRLWALTRGEDDRGWQ
jgi:hypothetical protein